MRNDFQRKEEISQLIKEYRTTQNELIKIQNKKQGKIGTIGLLLLIIIMYIGLCFWRQKISEERRAFCGEPTEALGNTM